MPHDPEAFAEMVVLTIKAALAPITERLAASEQSNRELSARVNELSGLRDRVTTVEAKAAPGLSAAEMELTLRDRLEPVRQELSNRIDGLEQRRMNDADALRDRIQAMETKPAHVPQVLESGPSAAELELSIRDRLEPVAKRVSTLSERIAVLEVRAPVPGPAGEDGADGKPGVDGVGFDDLAVEFDGDRTLALKFVRGDVKKTFPIALPFQRYQGVYQQGKSYDVGDTVTYGGHLWHCKEETITPPGDASNVWQMAVRKGRDGKDGRDAERVPVVSVGRS